MSNSAFCLSSISKKIVTGLFGLFLATFLVVHLCINLLMLAGDGGAMFDTAVHFMTTNPAIKVFEIVLFGGFLVHIIIGIILFIQNRSARPVNYYKSNQSETAFFSKYMVHTGAIIFVFLILHFINFYFVKLEIVSPPEGLGSHEFFPMSALLFSNKLYSLVYILFFLFLGFHLNHAIQSAFQTVGFNHNKYTPTIKIISTAYALFITIGFSIIPIYFMFFYSCGN